MGQAGENAGVGPYDPHRIYSRRELLDRWERLYGTPAPAKVPTSLLTLAVAYRLQERESGALKPSLQRQLLREAEASRPARRRAVAAGAGTVLMREWQGVTHTVTVLEKGVVYAGKAYRSLTEVAEVITGSHWSGPAFFGLTAGRGGARG